MLKSVNQWCFPANTSLETVLEVTRKAGFDAIELNLYEAGGIGLTADMGKEEVQEIGRLVASYGLQLRSLSTSLLWKSPLSSPDEKTRAAGRAVVEKQLQFANWLEVDTVLVVPGVVTPEVNYAECYERSQQELVKLAERAEHYGVKIGVENVWNKFLLSPLEMARYVDELNSPYIGVYFDVGNVLLYAFPEQWIRILGSRIFKVHVKDFKPGVGTGQGFVPLLAGDVNWQAVKSALTEIGYSDTITAELSPYAADPYQLIYDTSRHMDVIIG
ncbi:sugar phosphate isomerase/epimerase family protein [Paenibacillus senegalensis]|uniref:sugar phosphate isomerase/epimerase family protein n=1 Tax=Paenibacillus senegalensis TaxID=1465766 RepID=UPI000289AC85|nr:sugar phosphate isomerase/epimerase family protein [Paenibacillus senegalensis]